MHSVLNFMLSEIYQRMILKLGKPYVMEENERKPKVIFFVGPTGVGKTTTIAKIASSFRVEHKKKVALLTADTYIFPSVAVSSNFVKINL